MSSKHGLPKHFRTYGNKAQAEKLVIWEAAQAATPASGFFAPVSIKSVNYSDGSTHLVVLLSTRLSPMLY